MTAYTDINGDVRTVYISYFSVLRCLKPLSINCFWADKIMSLHIVKINALGFFFFKPMLVCQLQISICFICTQDHFLYFSELILPCREAQFWQNSDASGNVVHFNNDSFNCDLKPNTFPSEPLSTSRRETQTFVDCKGMQRMLRDDTVIYVRSSVNR